MKIKWFLSVILSTLFCSAEAEVIHGPANIRLGPHKQIVFSLNDGVNVECGILESGWFKIGITIKLTQEQYAKKLIIKKGEKLLDTNGKELGIAIEDIPNSMTDSYTFGGAAGSPKNYEMAISGFTSEVNIEINSIPEYLLNEFVEKHKADLTYATFKDFLLTNHYDIDGQLKKFYPNLHEYMISESSITGPSIIDRIRFVFDEKNLLAIIHSRKLNIANVKYHDLLYGNKIIIFNTPNGVSIEKFIRDNKQSYNGAN